MKIIFADDEVIVNVVLALREVIHVIFDDGTVDLAIAIADSGTVDVFQVFHEFAFVLNVADLVDAQFFCFIFEYFAIRWVPGYLP